MFKYKKFAYRGLLAGAFIALFAIAGGFVLNNKPLKAADVRDCDSNAVIYCGALTVGELQQKYGSTSDVAGAYNAFGISADGVNSLSNNDNVKLGEVHKDGTVWLKTGQQVGANAITAGRNNIAGSTAISGTPFYMRTPSVSFKTETIDAFIGFQNGKPAWAILSACGNPVKWEKPHTTLTKQIAKPDASGWTKDATFNNNSDIQYLLTIANDGKADDTNVRVIDHLPANQTYVAGTTVVNGVKAVDGITTTGINLGKVNPGTNGNVYITFHAKINVPTTTCGAANMTNTAREDSDLSATNEDSATSHVNVQCQSVKCDSLTGPDSMMVGDTGTFTANVSDASLVAAYTFTVNGNKVTANGNTLAVKLTEAGSYTIAATITPKDGVTNGGSTACVKTVTVKEKEQPKTVSCTSLTGPDSMMVGDTGTFTATASDASLVSGYNFTVNGNAVNANGNVLAVKLTEAGSYTIAAKVTPKTGVTDGGSANCVKKVTVKEQPKVSCTALNGPATVNFGDSAIYTIATSDDTLVSAYSFTVDGNAVTTGVNGNKLTTTLSAGDHTITAKITPKSGVTDGGSTACSKTVHVNEQPKVVTSCDALTASKSSILLGETTTLTAAATASNTSISEVIFKVDGQVVQSGSTKTTYDFKPATKGDHTVSVSVKFANGEVKGDDEACSKKITVTEQVTPIYSCDAFDVSATSVKIGDTLKVTVKYTAAGGATFDHAVVDFGEGKVNVAKDQASNNSFTASYAYKASKDYNIAATLTFMVNGTATDVTNSKCSGKVTVTSTPTVLSATTLPNTGAGSAVGLFAAVTVAGAAMHSVFTRRSLRR